MASKGWTLAEAARLSQDMLPGCTALAMHVECADGSKHDVWTAPWDGREPARMVRRFCKRWGLVPVKVSPMVSYSESQLPYLIRLDMAISL